MRKTFFLSFVILALLVGCASPAGGSPAAVTSATTTQLPATNTPLPPAPSPSPTPSPTSTPLPKDFNAQNFSQFTGVQSYGSVLAKYFDTDSFAVLIFSMDYSEDGSIIAIGGCILTCSSTLGGRRFLLLLDPELQQPILEIPVDDLTQIWDTDLTPDGSVLIFSIRGQVLRFDRATGLISLVYLSDAANQVPFTAISPDGKTLVIVTESELTALNLADDSEIATLSGVFWGQNSPFFNTQGNRLLVYSQQTDRDAVVYDTSTWKEIGRFPVAGSGKAAISSEGSLVATLGAKELNVKLYDLTSGTEKALPITPYNEVSSLIFNPADDLLLSFGEPDSSVDIFEGVQIIELSSGSVIGSMTQNNNPGWIKFSADGSTFLRFSFSATELELWSLPTPDIFKIESLVKDFFAAVTSSDFKSAATMTQLDSYARDEVTAAGLNPDDLPTTFTTLCAEDEVPCLPLGRIVRVMADFDRGWDYYAIVTLQQPDGSELMFDSITPYEMLGIVRLEDGSFKISTLHPGMRYPYKE